MREVYNTAVRLLARREHGVKDLSDKLSKRGYPSALIIEAIARCQHQGLQSDVRFAESLCRRRVQQGYGPLRIEQELQANCIAETLIEQAIHQQSINWLDAAQAVWEKKFKSPKNSTYAELQKQKRFLQYRGFSHDLINAIFKTILSTS